MLLRIDQGDAFCCHINAHRHAWDGTICQGATHWNCGQELAFREDFCDAGIERCHYIHTFDPENPWFSMRYRSKGWLLDKHPTLLDNQIMMLVGNAFQEPTGQIGRANRQSRTVVYGMYRVRKVIPLETGGHMQIWRVKPYEDGWVRFDTLNVKAPTYHAFGADFLKRLERRKVEYFFSQALKAMDDAPEDKFPKHLRQRVEHFAQHLNGWMDEASGLIRELQEREKGLMQMQGRSASKLPSPDGDHADRFRTKALAGLSSIKVTPQPLLAFRPLPMDDEELPPITPATIIGQVPHLRGPAPQAPPPEIKEETAPIHGNAKGLLNSKLQQQIEDQFNHNMLQSLLIGTLTKPLLILRGVPGVGKSRLAQLILQRCEEDQRLVVTVPSTWRGREDLMGYINPMDHKFTPYPFTQFLRKAEQAWDKGDRSPFVVVFEEFNLSPPEYWLSEVLVRSQYAMDDREGRSIPLGGTSVEGWPEGKKEVFLSPAIHFVATINSDHTTQPLSPRVLDRSSMVEVKLSPRRALEIVAFDLEEKQRAAIEDLHNELEFKGATFSYRTAESLNRCLQQQEILRMNAWQIVDRLIVQEMLSKVRLFAGDASDYHLVTDGLASWCEQYRDELPLSAEHIEHWKDLLDNGQDLQ